MHAQWRTKWIWRSYNPTGQIKQKQNQFQVNVSGLDIGLAPLSWAPRTQDAHTILSTTCL